ncbi:hypothetical protein JCM21900_005998 [Sporobolomyces salmonicolor]
MKRLATIRLGATINLLATRRPALASSFPVAFSPSPPFLSPRLAPLRRDLATQTVPPAVPFRTHIGPPPTSPSAPRTPTAHTFFHTPTWTWTYVVACPSSLSAVVIDTALDFDPKTNTISTETADLILAFVREKGYRVEHILETHAHADHLTAAQYYKAQLGGGVPVGIGERITQTQEFFAGKYDVPREELDGAFDRLWKDDEEFMLGDCQAKVMHLPGHTVDHVGYKFGDFVFVGDSIFLPTVGSARADFPFGSPSTLFSSSQRLLSLPSGTRLFSGHHYPTEEEKNVCSATVEEQRVLNRHLREGMEESEFVRMRRERDEGLKEPGLLHQSLQVNIRAGHLPKGSDGQPYLRIPIKAPNFL